MPSLRCCLFTSKPESRDRSLNFPPRPTIEEVSDVCLRCGRCGASLTIPQRAIVFVCSSCRCVNRVIFDERNNQRRTSIIDCNVGEAVKIPNTPSLFQLGDSATTEGDVRSAIPVCSVCLDGVGDMILETCSHGGICEDCSRHIALNKAVGGSHCPKCRQDITQVLRIGEVQEDYVRAKLVELPELPQNNPPKVPPPVGYRKEKEKSNNTAEAG